MKFNTKTLILSIAALMVGAYRTQSQVVYREPQLRPQMTAELPQLMQLMGGDQQDMIPVFKLPKNIDNRQLILEASAGSALTQQPTMHFGEFRFGKAFTVDLDASKDGLWVHHPSLGSVWMLAIESRSAFSLNLIFDKFELPSQGELYIRSAISDEIIGPFTSDNNKEHLGFATAPLAGNRVILEYYTPVQQSKPVIQIGQIIHGYRPMFEASNGRSGQCNINAACRNEWDQQSRSVAMILSNNGQGFCSGAMINNAKQDGRQLFLTAYHCVGYSNTTNNMLLFNYQQSGCGTDSPPSRKMTAHGLKKLAQWRYSDFAILELEETLPESYNVYLAGWTADPKDVPVNPVGIHHPSADIKKISFFNGNCSSACWGWCDAERDPLYHWKVEQWTNGTTEPGSSGSPLFDGETRRIVGQLHGGSASCLLPDGYDLYGKLCDSFGLNRETPFEKLSSVLDPDAAGIQAMDGAELNDLRQPKLLFQSRK